MSMNHIKPASQWTREDCIAWLVGNDPNGVYLDGDCVAEGLKPLTHEQALALCAKQGAFDSDRVEAWMAAGERIMVECFGEPGVLADGDVIGFVRSLRNQVLSASQQVEVMKNSLRRRGVII